MDAASQTPELVQGLSKRLNTVLEQLRGFCVRASHGFRFRQLKREEQGNQLLLGPIVQISFHSATLAIGGVDKASPRLSHVVELGSKLDLKPGVL
jgi:hypothetical protein